MFLSLDSGTQQVTGMMLVTETMAVAETIGWAITDPVEMYGVGPSFGWIRASGVV